MNDKYLTHICNQPEIKLVIMGKDPFPKGATGIPFCKPSWEEQLNPTSSGFIVINSLGISRNHLEADFVTPTNCFFELASKGIVFLNLSYSFIDGSIRKEKHQVELRKGFETNEKFLLRANKILLCGEANKNRWNGFDAEVDEVVHPDIRNGISRYERIRKDWLATWSFNSLNTRYNLNL